MHLGLVPRFNGSRRRCAAPTRLVRLSEYTCLAGPLLATNLRSALIKEDIVRSCPISKCIARVVIHVKRHPYFFTSDRFILVRKGPK